MWPQKHSVNAPRDAARLNTDLRCLRRPPVGCLATRVSSLWSRTMTVSRSMSVARRGLFLPRRRSRRRESRDHGVPRVLLREPDHRHGILQYKGGAERRSCCIFPLEIVKSIARQWGWLCSNYFQRSAAVCCAEILPSNSGGWSRSCAVLPRRAKGTPRRAHPCLWWWAGWRPSGFRS